MNRTDYYKTQLRARGDYYNIDAYEYDEHPGAHVTVNVSPSGTTLGSIGLYLNVEEAVALRDALTAAIHAIPADPRAVMLDVAP